MSGAPLQVGKPDSTRRRLRESTSLGVRGGARLALGAWLPAWGAAVVWSVVWSVAVAAGGGCTPNDDGGPGEGEAGEGEAGEGEAGEGEGETAPIVIFPKAGIDASELGVVVNTNDPQSVAVAAAYVAARGIPAENVVEVSIPTTAVITPEDFAPAKVLVDGLPDTVQALALSWSNPYGVGCMSIGTALGVEYNEARFCSVPCAATEASPLHDSDTHAPFTDLGIRPVMMLAGASVDDANALIARGIAADGTAPGGTGFLVHTSDGARTVRDPQFGAIVDEWTGALDLQLGNETVDNTDDVLFYFTGLADVPGIDTDTYRPGAIADHLTSFGGQLPTASGQMSDLRWLQVGATASSGTVIEPCNFTQKFSDPAVVIDHYFHGEPVIEAYAKSIEMPGESLMVGEPLASPWGASTSTFDGSTLTLETFLVRPGRHYVVESAEDPAGPFTFVKDVQTLVHEKVTVVIADAHARIYRLAEAP